MATTEEIIRKFFETVRSGRNPDAAHDFMADRMLAHQVTSEHEMTLERTPGDYADHVRELQEFYGSLSLEIQELIAQNDRVYVRWKQHGTHTGVVHGIQPTGKPVVQLASAVYRVENGKIAEYWIQIDREGIRAQLDRNAKEL